MDKYDSEENKNKELINDAYSVETGSSFSNPKPGNNPNKELENVLLGKVVGYNEVERLKDKERMEDAYMKMSSEMANEVMPDLNDVSAEKESEHKIGSEQNNMYDQKTMGISGEGRNNTENTWGSKNEIERLNDKERMKYAYMKMSSEMANEVQPDLNNIRTEKESEHKVGSEENNKQDQKTMGKNGEGKNNAGGASGGNNGDNGCRRPKDKTKIAWQWLMLGVAVVIIGILLFGWINENNKLQMNQNELVGVYYKSYDNVASEMNDLEKKLAKVQIVSSEEMQVTLLTEIWSTSNIMRSEIGQLPLQTDISEALSRFVTQAGDYCYILTKNVLNGQDITADQQAQLYTLQQNCSELAALLTTMRAEGKVVFLTAQEQEAVASAAKEEGTTLETIKSDIQQYPSLIYDGPFSDSTQKQTAKSIESEAEITAEAAQEVAKKVAGEGIANVTREEDVEGQLPAYTFTITYDSGVTTTINITKKGGKPLYMIQNINLEAANEKPTDETIAKCKQVAIAYLKSLGYENMQPNYIQYYSGTILVNMTYTINSVTVYPDIIKVWVDISSFNVTGLDAKNYIYSHVARNITSPKLTVAQAKAYVSKNLMVDSVKLCIIPTETLTEDYCYEFSGVYKGLRFLVYIDADTGAERDVMQIIDTDQGQLAQ